MRLRIAAAVDVVELFEARLLGDQEETLASTRLDDAVGGSAGAHDEHRLRVGAHSIEVSSQAVPRFRVAVIDALGRWMYLAHGTTPLQARARAEFWIAREPAVVH